MLATELHARVRQSVARSITLCRRSAELVAVGAVLERRHRPLRGASADSDPVFQQRIEQTLERTRRGGLPAPLPGKLWISRGSLYPCAGCGEKIAGSETEYEVEIVPTLRLKFHTVCYAAWKAYAVDA
jgi:hypothetical protein